MSAVNVNIATNSFLSIGASKSYLPGKKTTKPAAKRFKPDEPAIQTPLVPLPSNQVQNLEQPIPESTSVIPSNSRFRKSLKIRRPNKKSAEQNNEPIQNPDSAQPTTCPRNSISIEATPAALEVLSCEPSKPHKNETIEIQKKTKRRGNRKDITTTKS